MDPIITKCIANHQETQEALTNLAGLDEFVVLGYESDEDEIVWFCKNIYDVSVCPDCQQISSKIHQKHKRVKRDLSVFGKRSYWEYEHRRFKCDRCRKPFTEVIAGIPFGGRCTSRYEKYIYDHYRESTISHIANQEALGYKTAAGIFYQQAEAQVTASKTRQVKRLGIDEISMKKRHKQFILVLSDLDRNCVIDVIEERHKEKLDAWFDALTDEQKSAIEEVSMDMWNPYRLSVQAKLPEADIVADRFHVMQNLNRAVTTTRRQIQRNASADVKEQLKGSRWVLVKNQTDLSDKESETLEHLYLLSPELRDLHILKEAFRDIFESSLRRDDAIWALALWCDSAIASGHSRLESFVSTLENWANQVVNYFNHRTTQGFVEGMNNKIKLIMRRGYGYRNFGNFSLRILAECGRPT